MECRERMGDILKRQLENTFKNPLEYETSQNFKDAVWDVFQYFISSQNLDFNEEFIDCFLVIAEFTIEGFLAFDENENLFFDRKKMRQERVEDFVRRLEKLAVNKGEVK